VGFIRRQRVSPRSLIAVTDQVVAQMRDGLAVHDEDGNLMLWNPAAETITGWSIDEAERRFVASLPEGLVDVGGGCWVDIRHTPVEMDGHPMQVTLFADARHQVALSEAYTRLNDLVTADPLTGLPNRVHAEDRLALSVSLATRDERPIGLLLVDLDRFKLINESLGHRAGDTVLEEVARRLRAAIREGDTAARVGGDEFVVILHTIDASWNADRTATNILEQLAVPFRVGDHEVYVSASIGVATFPAHGESSIALMQAADLAMHRAKADGGNASRTYEATMTAMTTDRLLLGAELHRAIARNEFEVFYQPQIDIDQGTVVGVEALVRWHHPDLGLLPPGRFLPVAEEDGAIVAIDRFVLSTACAQLLAWQTAGLPVPMVSVNLSARTVALTDMTEIVSNALDVTGLSPQCLEIEVSEHVVADAEGDVERKLGELRTMGVQLAIDDFGTGYSSLGHLKRFPLDTIKLDRSFVADVTGQPRASDIAVLRAVVTMAGDLGLRCVAEGVETIAQRKVLRYLRCHLVQGFLYCRAVPAIELSEMVERAFPSLPVALSGT
jgi:diguanylate cyclase (GGDEF)-like protein